MMQLTLRALKLLCWSCLVWWPGGSAAQSVYGVVYRPPDVHYQVWETPRFRVIYQTGAEGLAQEAVEVLDAAAPQVEALVGLRRSARMPLVLNAYNDRSNGFVSPLPYRIEVEGAAIQGKTLSPGHASWLDQVMPHELTHALHAQVHPRLGIGGLLGLAAPDWARALNFTAPPGFIEGLAVYLESQPQPQHPVHAGRLNYGYRNMEFRAAMGPGRAWRLAQIMDPPAYTMPLDRFYIGGGFFVQYLADSLGVEAVQKTLRTYSRWPYFGFGVALRYGTGAWPRTLGRGFMRWAQDREARRVAALGPLTEPTYLTEGAGVETRRPRWRDTDTLLVYHEAYNERAGFYTVDAATGHRRALAHEAITEDYYYSLDPATQTVHYARYVFDPLAPIKATAEAFALDVATGQTTRLTHGGRVYAPVMSPGGTRWAVRNQGPFTGWVAWCGADSLCAVSAPARARFKEIAPAPDGQTAAVLLGVAGRQGLFRATGWTQGLTLEPWVVFADGFVYDPAWSADGRYLLFAADPGGVANIYALDVQTDAVYRLTNVAYGALEPALSPDGQRLAYVHYTHEKYRLAVLPFDLQQAVRVPRAQTQAGADVDWAALMAPAPAPAVAGTPYRAWRYLKPRAFYPWIVTAEGGDNEEDAELGLGLGVGFSGTDPLQQWAYGAYGYRQAGRWWGAASVQTGKQAFRPRLSVFQEPFTRLVQRVDAETGTVVETVRVGFQERGVRLAVALPVLLGFNVYTSSLSVGLGGEVRQVGQLDAAHDPIGMYSTRYTLEPQASFLYRVQANGRDLIPNTGLVIGSFAELDVAGDGSLGQAWETRLRLYLPWLARWNHGIRLEAAVLTQNRGSVFNLDRFVPRGYEDDLFLGAGTFVKTGVEYQVPLWYVDDGLLTVPITVHAVYAYGFAETLFSTADVAGRFSAVGAGLGVEFRLAHILPVAFRVGLARLLEAGQWQATYR